ncbi:hypothetical protein RvY_04100 [Ramazzottius varieornatus]|uniref:Uncharacterized protein n=1 Tax=Ramazzottius varieornatus TaxID=947166 RepID=A0A1D1UQG2_RAMVA|nr:hypothetical protein RvY_04100 [Ramazzottius varieornatus]
MKIREKMEPSARVIEEQGTRDGVVSLAWHGNDREHHGTERRTLQESSVLNGLARVTRKALTCEGNFSNSNHVTKSREKRNQEEK